MFYPHLIESIGSDFKVLEIGPGATPHPRSNEFLEFNFCDEETIISQRGNVKANPDFGGRRVHYYNGGRFPFPDKAFDYVIASHVVEHTPDPEAFMAEVFRVGGGKGYLEFPLPPYEYMFDLDVHLSYVWFDELDLTLHYVKKPRDLLVDFSNITSELRRGLELGWDDLIRNNLSFFMQGFEFSSPFAIQEERSIRAYYKTWKNPGTGLTRRLVRKVETLFPQKQQTKP
jgi:SAM-dependent methyltransferase